MKTLRDLFVEGKSFYAEIKLENGRKIWLEALDGYGGSIQHDFDENLLNDNILAEYWMSSENDDFNQIYCNNLNMTIEEIKSLVKN